MLIVTLLILVTLPDQRSSDHQNSEQLGNAVHTIENTSDTHQNAVPCEKGSVTGKKYVRHSGFRPRIAEYARKNNVTLALLRDDRS